MRSLYRNCFYAALLCLVCLVFRIDARHPAFSEERNDWTWDVLVVPPDEGWETTAGRSIQNTLLWHRDEISESGDGVRGRDINFIFLPPLNEDSVKNFVLQPTAASMAVLSFASSQVDRDLIDVVSPTGLPLMLAGGEGVFFYRQGRLLPFLFSLDLFRDYRCRAFAQYAKKILPSQTRLGIIATRFTLNEEREAKIASDLLTEKDFMPMPFWVDSSVVNTFELVQQELTSYSDGVLISYVGGMATKELWRGMMNLRSSYRLWYGGIPDSSFLSFSALLFADQSLFLETTGGFETLKRSFWTSRTVSVEDKSAAARANALVLWLQSGIHAIQGDLNSMPRHSAVADLLVRLKNVKDIPFGNQSLTIDPATHRPRERDVHILETRNRKFYILDTLRIEGLGYYDY